MEVWADAVIFFYMDKKWAIVRPGCFPAKEIYVQSYIDQTDGFNYSGIYKRFFYKLYKRKAG